MSDTDETGRESGQSDEEAVEDIDRKSTKEDEQEASSAAANSLEEEISRNFKYSTLCKYLDYIQQIHFKNKCGKEQVLKKLMTKWEAVASKFTDGVVSFYPVLRIMVNSLDRRKFGMKSVSLLNNLR